MTLSTLIKFVGAGNGTGGGAGNAAAAGVATGDILMMIAGIVLAVAGVCAVVFARRYASATTGAHGQTSIKISAPIIAAFAAILLGLTLSVVGATQMKAHADTNDALQASGDVIATVDEQTGEVTFSDVDIKNTSEKPYVIETFELSAAEEITTIDEVEWNIKIGDVVVYEGVAGDIQIISDHITLNAGETIKLTVSATNLSSDLAKSLIDKEVATANLYYEIKYFRVDATVDDSTHGTISYTPEGTEFSVEYGTTYTVDNENSKITFGTGNDAKSITFNPASGFKLNEWQLNGQSAVSGTVNSELAFTAITKSAIEYKSLTVKYEGKDPIHYYPVFKDETLSDDIKFFYSTDEKTFTQISGSGISGKYKMSDLSTYRDTLYYLNSGSTSFNCVTGIIESYNTAFGSDVPKVEGTKADTYKGNFSDVQNAKCETLLWYSGTAGNYDALMREPTINDKNDNQIGIETLQACYTVYGDRGALSCVVSPFAYITSWKDKVYYWASDSWVCTASRDWTYYSVIFTRNFS